MVGAGAFVRFGGELGDVYEGFVPARTLRGERFDLNETETALVGRRTGRRGAAGRPARGDRPLGRARARPRRPRAGREAESEGRPSPAVLRRLIRRSVNLDHLMAKKAKRKLASGDVASNRRASHKYEFVEKFECRDRAARHRGQVAALGQGAARRCLRGRLRRGGLAAQPPHPALSAGGRREPRSRAAAKAAPAPLRDRAADRADAAEGPDADPDPHLLQGAAGEGRARARARQGGARPPARDPRPRGQARGRARAAPPHALGPHACNSRSPRGRAWTARGTRVRR